MSLIDPKDIVAMIPTVINTAKTLVGLVSPRAASGIGFGGKVALFVLDAEEKGMTPEAIVDGVGELYVELVKDLKYGVP
jgi:hypothetical protein